MNDKWFTSDWHLGHANIMSFCKRPFNSVDEMNEIIIERFNNTVKKGDIVYFLGDFCFGEFKEYFPRLRRDIIFNFIKGNHDKKISKIKYNVDYFSDGIKDINMYNQSISLCHYPLRSWNKSHFNSWCLHGHHHYDTSGDFSGKIMNVCVDLNNFYPFSYEDVRSYMINRVNNWDYIPNNNRKFIVNGVKNG